jgi:hypothetical protein
MIDIFSLITMSENTLKFHRKLCNQFMGSTFNAFVQDLRLRDVWWQADTLVDEINTRHQLGDDIKATKLELQRVMGKVYHDMSTEGNIFVGTGSCGEQLKLFRHNFKAARKAGGSTISSR